MAALKIYTIFIFAISSLIASTSTVMASTSSLYSSTGIKGAYWPSWASAFPPSAIDTSLFTHVYYAFLRPNNVTFKFEIDNATALLMVNFTSTLHAKNPAVKTLFSIGGASDGAMFYVPMASSSLLRRNFIMSSIEVARKFGFDGIDLDWESPPTPHDMDNFGILLEEWRAEVKNEAEITKRPQLLLSAATYFAVEFFLDAIPRKYPVDSINKNLDWINAMCYDYHGAWEPSYTGAQAALFGPNTNITTSYGLKSWLKAGIKKKKLIMGLPLYGRTWKLKDPSSSGIGAAAVGAGPGVDGTLAYTLVESFNQENNATVVFDMPTLSTYSVGGDTWITYDDERATTVKLVYAKGLGIGGYFFWAVSQDRNGFIPKTASDVWDL